MSFDKVSPLINIEIIVMGYSKYDVEDFLTDENFRKWIFKPTDNSTRFWESVSRDNPELGQKMKLARQIILQMEFSHLEPLEEDSQNILNNILRDSESKQQVKAEWNGHHRIRRQKITAMLAAAVLFIAANLFVYHIYLTPAAEDDPIVQLTKESSKGQKSTIILSDGTKVKLNSESSLTYTESFNDHERKVSLKGEAFFEVVKDPLRPFIVETEHLNTTALGTSFNVRAYDADKVEVSLITGKVLVQKADDPTDKEVLEPGELVFFSTSKQHMEKKEFDVQKEALWRKGIIYWKDTPFKEAIKQLERWYGVEIKVTDMPNKDLLCNGYFDNDYLANVLMTLEYSLDFEFQITNKTVHITFKN